MKIVSLITLILLFSCKPKLGSKFSLASRSGAPAGPGYAVSVDQFDQVKISLSEFVPDGKGTIVDSTSSDLGIVDIESGGIVSYTHLIEDPLSKDSFVVEVKNEDDRVEKYKIDVSILENALAPIAIDDALSVKSNRNETVHSLSNDSDPRNEEISLSTILVGPKNGVAEIFDGKIRYIPNDNYEGEDELVYQIQNESGAKGAAKVLINVVENNGGAGGGDGGNGGITGELPMDIVFVFTTGGKSKVEGRLYEEAQFILKTINDSQKFNGDTHNAYYLRDYRLIEDNQLAIATTGNYVQTMNQYSKEGALNKIIVEDFSGGILGVAHGIDCLLQKTGTTCRSGSSARFSSVITEFNSLHITGGGCDAAPLGCTATHEVGHHLGWFHLSGESDAFVNYTRCNLTGIGYFRTSTNINYTQELTDNNGVRWYTGPHAMRRGGGTPARNGGFYPFQTSAAEGYPPNATEIHKCYNRLSYENLQ